MNSSNSLYGSLDNLSPDQICTLLPQQSEERKHEFALRRQNARRKLVAEQGAVFDKLFSREDTSLKHRQKREKDSTPPQEFAQSKKHSFLYTVLSPSSNKPQATIFKRFISTIILLDLCLFVLSTDQPIMDKSPLFFHATEGIASSIFLVEYIARLWTITEKKKYKELGPLKGRLAYASTFAAIIDLMAALPFFLEIPTGWNLPTLTYLRFFRLFRILKTEGFVRALDAVHRVIWFNREILYVATVLCFFLVMITSVLLYYFRPRNIQDAEDFQSIAATCYLAMLMLTGQGGPDGDLPWYTKAVVLLTSVFSVAMFAIPASMLTWGFEAEAARMAKRQRRRVLEQRQSTSATLSSSTDSDHEIDTTDEEYFKIIAGEEPVEEVPEDPFLKQLRESFQRADADMDGTLTLSEFMKMQSSTAPSEGLVTRINNIELQIQETNDKLDRIIEALAKK